MSGTIFNSVITGKTQEDGAFEIATGVADRFTAFQIQAEIVSEEPPSAGSLAVAIRSPGATDFVEIGTIDLSGDELIKTFGPAFAAEIRFTPSDYDGDSYNVIVTAGNY